MTALTTRFSMAGKQQVRAVADRFRERASTSNVAVVAPDFVRLTAPERTQVGSGFDVGVKVTAQPFAVRNAVLTLKGADDREAGPTAGLVEGRRQDAHRHVAGRFHGYGRHP